MDEFDAVCEVQAVAQAGTFWELRAARLAGTADGEIAAHQADQYAALLTIQEVMAEPEPEQARVLS